MALTERYAALLPRGSVLAGGMQATLLEAGGARGKSQIQDKNGWGRTR